MPVIISVSSAFPYNTKRWSSEDFRLLCKPSSFTLLQHAEIFPDHWFLINTPSILPQQPDQSSQIWPVTLPWSLHCWLLLQTCKWSTECFYHASHHYFPFVQHDEVFPDHWFLINSPCSFGHQPHQSPNNQYSINARKIQWNPLRTDQWLLDSKALLQIKMSYSIPSVE